MACDGHEANLIIHIRVVKSAEAWHDCNPPCSETRMTRTYTLKKRAQSQAETRRRIVEAAVDLHGTVGPAVTTFSMVAERAGVQRHTLYAHFPDERSLLLACSGFEQERDPPPDAEPWRGIEDQPARLRVGLGAIYGWYERNAALLSCVLRDEYYPPVREISELRYGPIIAGWVKVLGARLTGEQQALMRLAFSFFTWRTLVRDAGLNRGAAVGLMARAIESAGKRDAPSRRRTPSPARFRAPRGRSNPSS